MVKNLKIVEYFAMVVVMVVFLLAVGKYYYLHVEEYINTREDKFLGLSKKDIEENRVTTTTYNLKLNRSMENGQWELIEESGQKNTVFIVGQDGFGNISILKKDEEKLGNYLRSANIQGIRTYYSQQNGPIETEIPFSEEREVFEIFEQEDVVPIIGYHFIVPDGQEIRHTDLEITQSDFRRQVKFMTEDLGCRWFTFSQIMDEYILKGRKAPQKACVMNFDDGRRNNFTQAFPVFEEFGVRATFYIITDRIGSSDKYMTWEQVDKLYKNGHEIGSHTVNSSSLVDALAKGGEGRREELKQQVENSLKVLHERGYKATTFAYPRGEWNEEVVKAVQDAGYSAARDIRKKDTWRDRRTVTIGKNNDFIWHMHYIKPEGMNNDKLRKIFSYDGWWQFEEEVQLAKSMSAKSTGNVEILSSIRPTDRSYASIRLFSDQGILNKFRVSQDGEYNIEFFGAIAKVANIEIVNVAKAMEMYVDDIKVPLNKISKLECLDYNYWEYCTYGAKVNLTRGEHTLTMKSMTDKIFLDKFRMFRELPTKDSYDVEIIETRRLKSRKK